MPASVRQSSTFDKKRNSCAASSRSPVALNEGACGDDGHGILGLVAAIVVDCWFGTEGVEFKFSFG